MAFFRYASGSVLERGEVDENDVAAAADNSSPRFDNKAPRSAPAPRKSGAVSILCHAIHGICQVTYEYWFHPLCSLSLLPQ